MYLTLAGILIRIFSNSYLNVFQKILTTRGEKSSVINFYTYLGLSLAGVLFLHQVSYKPVVALIFGIIFLHEIPTISALLALVLIITGTYFVLGGWGKSKNRNIIAIFYRILALICSGTEAVFIKKIILITGTTNCFILWALSGLLFSSMIVAFSRHKPVIKEYKYQFLLILAVGIMQYSTNFVFARMNVSYALALFQLSTLLSVFLGVNMFHEAGLKKKIAGSIIMILGAVILILW